MKQTFEGWMVFDKGGRAELESFDEYEVWARNWMVYESSTDWYTLENNGYTCKPVTVTVEVKDET